MAASDKDLITQGRQLAVFIYLGAKHMVTGYDHLLFLFGVIFFLYRLQGSRASTSRCSRWATASRCSTR